MSIAPAIVVAAYLLGSIPSGAWLARLAGVDIRQVGSGNIGATNVTRILGRRFGLITLVADLLKGLAPVAAALWLGLADSAAAATAVAAVAGHSFSIFLRFSGGKGVATGLGVCLALAPVAALAALLVFAVVAAPTRLVSLASIAGSLALPVTSVLYGYPTPTSLAALTISALIIVRHHENIRRLLAGSESRFRS